jgi:uncharacterized protein (DUF952 family)
MTIFHILGRDEWQLAETAGTYAPAGLATEGFIHFSTERQLLRSAERFFAGRDDVVVISVQEDRLTVPLRFELAHREPFPHLCGPLNLDAVVEVVPLPLVNGRHEVPAAWAARRNLFVRSPEDPG